MKFFEYLDAEGADKIENSNIEKSERLLNIFFSDALGVSCNFQLFINSQQSYSYPGQTFWFRQCLASSDQSRFNDELFYA